MSAYPNGRFVWFDLMTTDVPAAQAFYTTVVGWTARDSGMPGDYYTLLSAASTDVGGIMPLREHLAQSGVKPTWMMYIGVDDVDAFAVRVKDAGGVIHRDPTDIPGVGRFAVVADPHGATFVLFWGNGEPREGTPNLPGHVGWHELYTADLDSAWDFYSTLFGWTKAQAVDMGPMGLYQTFTANGPQGGGMMNKPPNIPVPFWGLYFTVEGSITAAVERAKEAGGQLLQGPHEVPGGAWIAHCLDPQGATFNLTSATQ